MTKMSEHLTRAPRAALSAESIVNLSRRGLLQVGASVGEQPGAWTTLAVCWQSRRSRGDV